VKGNKIRLFVVLGFAALFFGIYLTMMMGKGLRKESLTPTFSTQFTDEYGLDALFTLLIEEGYNPEKNFFRLDQADLVIQDNLVLMAPLDEMMIEQQEYLIERVKEGMTILACVRTSDNFLEGATIKTVETRDPDAFREGHLALEAAGPHPLLEGVKEIVFLPNESAEGVPLGVFGREVARDFSYYFYSDSITLIPLLEAKGEVHLAYAQVGKGRIFLVSHPYLFTNEGIGKADNAVLVMNIFRRMKRDSPGRLLFDEYHQGFPIDRMATPLNEPEVRVMAWSVFIIFILAIYSLARKPGRPVAPPDEPRRNIGEFVESVASVYYTKGDNTLLNRDITLRFLNRIKNLFGVPQKENLKVDNQLLFQATRKWNKQEAESLCKLLNQLYHIPKYNREAVLKVVQEIRRFSIRNKLDQHG
jgi:hypothetical protein